VAVVACSSTDNGTVQLVTGEETNVFSQSPAVTNLVVNAFDSSGNPTQIGSGPPSSSTIDLGTQSENDTATLQVVGYDSSQVEVVAGESLGLQYGALAGSSLNLFVQRTNEWARLPSPPTDSRQAPTLAIISGEFLFIGGGSDPSVAASSQIYDFAPLSPVSGPPTLPRAPLSMPVIGTVGLVIDQGGATYYDFSQNLIAECPAPSGFGFGDVAGGQVIYDYDAKQQTLDAVFVVGATRTFGAPTAAVLEIDATDTSNSSYPTGNLHWFSLSAPRLGAAAAWVSENGELLIAGGSGEAPGLEVLRPASTSRTGSPLTQFAPDPTFGAGATDFNDGTHVLLAGGLTPTGQDAGVRELNYTCAAGDCSTSGVTAWGTAATGLTVPLTTASVFVLGTGTTYPALVVGNELESGLAHAFLLNSSGAKEVATKVPHVGGRAIQSPLGAGVLLFGGASEIEQLMPPL
jgi:hypothetical protein